MFVVMSTYPTPISLAGIDPHAPAWEISDEVLRRVQAARTDLDWNAQLELADELVAGIELA